MSPRRSGATHWQSRLCYRLFIRQIHTWPVWRLPCAPGDDCLSCLALSCLVFHHCGERRHQSLLLNSNNQGSSLVARPSCPFLSDSGNFLLDNARVPSPDSLPRVCFLYSPRIGNVLSPFAIERNNLPATTKDVTEIMLVIITIRIIATLLALGIYPRYQRNILVV
ncbi:hypothetical protein F4678DRAFT_438215 [Xylaria arbuscula]|nr:hypothetical protein F4678DRAFT_438215 [Xylaria arbuscula]